MNNNELLKKMLDEKVQQIVSETLTNPTPKEVLLVKACVQAGANVGMLFCINQVKKSAP